MAKYPKGTKLYQGNLLKYIVMELEEPKIYTLKNCFKETILIGIYEKAIDNWIKSGGTAVKKNKEIEIE